jgi:hypothetical protein
MVKLGAQGVIRVNLRRAGLFKLSVGFKMLSVKPAPTPSDILKGGFIQVISWVQDVICQTRPYIPDILKGGFS